MKAGLIMWTISNGSHKCSKSFPLVILTKLVIIPLKEQKMGSHAAGPFPELKLETGEKNLVLLWFPNPETPNHFFLSFQNVFHVHL